MRDNRPDLWRDQNGNQQLKVIMFILSTQVTPMKSYPGGEGRSRTNPFQAV